MIETNKATMKSMLQDMVRIRTCESEIIELFKKNIMFGLGHMSVGQEACPVGTMKAIRDTDYIFSNHRGHGHAIAKGVPVRKVIAELLSKKTGTNKGMGGSLHITDVSRRDMGANGIVGANFGLSLGAAYAVKYKKTDDIVVNFFGEGASNEGLFHEALNMASLWNLPLLMICENNLYAVTTPFKASCCVPRISDRAAAYGIPGKTVDGNDVLAVYEAVSEAAQYVRQGKPYLLELLTYRWYGHSLRVSNLEYRTREEEAEWKAKCPIKRLTEKLLAENICNQHEIDGMYEYAKKELEDAIEYAIASPSMTYDEIKDLVFAK